MFAPAIFFPSYLSAGLMVVFCGAVVLPKARLDTSLASKLLSCLLLQHPVFCSLSLLSAL
jgi:hypothetical protein